MAKEKKDSTVLFSYLPKTLLEWYASNQTSEFHQVSEHEGILCFIDVSGFTQLSSKFARQGKEGLELLTETLNTLFRSLEKTINIHNGDILKFSGDAVWVFFQNEVNIDSFFKDCLGSIDQLNTKLKSKNLDPLKIHAGAEKGEFKLISLGDNNTRLEAEIFGTVVSVVNKAADLAKDNQLVIGEKLKETLQNKFLFKKTKNNIFAFQNSKQVQSQNKIIKKNYNFTSVNYDIIQKYIPLDVLSRIKSGEKLMSITSEYRAVTSLFVNFKTKINLNSKIQIESLRGDLELLFNVIKKYNGNIARIDPYGQSHKLLILFGTPIKREFDELNAIKCAIEIINLKLQVTICNAGISKGELFCGDVGAYSRREFTVMGESINLAARLMAKSKPNQIIFDAEFRNSIPHEINSEEINLSLKGIAGDIKYHSFKNISETETTHASAEFEIIGQDEYLKELHKLNSPADNSKAVVCNVYGNRGSGKTSLAKNFLSEFTNVNQQFISCRKSLLYSKGWIIKIFLQKLLEVNDNDSLKTLISNKIDSKWQSLVSFLTGASRVETEWTEGLDQQARKDKTIQLIIYLIHIQLSKPFILLLDDIDKADEFSRELINALIENKPEQLKLVLVTSEIFKNKNIHNLELEFPSEIHWEAWFDNNFEKNKIEYDFIDKLLKISNGNPQFVTQFINHCLENRWLSRNQLTGKYEIADRSFEITIPDNLNNLNLIKFDTFPERERKILKIAAVLNVEFDAEMISSMSNFMDKDKIITVMKTLNRKNVLKYSHSTNKYEFVSFSMRDAIYSCVPQSELVKNHTKFAKQLEATDSIKGKKLLAYHYYYSNNYRQGFKHCFESALDTARDFLLNESAIYFDRCQKLLGKHGETKFTKSSLYNFFLKFVEFKVITGDYKDASKILRQWRNLSKKSVSKKSYINSLISSANILWKQAKYNRCEQILNGCLKLLSGKKFDSLKAQAFYLLAEVKRRQGAFEDALKMSEKALKYAQLSESKLITANAYNNQGLAYWGQGNLGKASISYQKCLEIGQGINDLNLKAKTANNLAIIKWELGEFISAQNLMEKALTIYYEIGDKRKEAYASGNLASLYKIFGKIDCAEEMFMRSDLIFEKLNDRHAHNYTIGNLGDIAIIRGDLSLANELFTTAFEFGREVDDKELMTESEIRFGDIQFFNNNFKSAEIHYDKALKDASEIGSSEYQLRSLIGLARVQIGLKNYEKALSAIQKLKEISKANNVIITAFEADFLQAEYYRINNNNSKAILLFKQVLEYASEQEIFELSLKCLARLYELDLVASAQYLNNFEQIQKKFISENRKTEWMTLINSKYFSHFSISLQKVF